MPPLSDHERHALTQMHETFPALEGWRTRSRNAEQPERGSEAALDDEARCCSAQQDDWSPAWDCMAVEFGEDGSEELAKDVAGACQPPAPRHLG